MSKSRWALDHLCEMASRYVDLSDGEGEQEITEARALLVAALDALTASEAECARLRGELANRVHPPRVCPITGREHFMNIELEGRQIATYGGPFDSYSIPWLVDDPGGQLCAHHFDHDRGHWVDDESVGLHIVDNEEISRLCAAEVELQSYRDASGILEHKLDVERGQYTIGDGEGGSITPKEAVDRYLTLRSQLAARAAHDGDVVKVATWAAMDEQYFDYEGANLAGLEEAGARILASGLFTWEGAKVDAFAALAETVDRAIAETVAIPASLLDSATPLPTMAEETKEPCPKCGDSKCRNGADIPLLDEMPEPPPEVPDLPEVPDRSLCTCPKSGPSAPTYWGERRAIRVGHGPGCPWLAAFQKGGR